MKRFARRLLWIWAAYLVLVLILALVVYLLIPRDVKDAIYNTYFSGDPGAF